MSRLADDILANVDVVDVVSRYVPLKRKWANYAGLSPFQNEKTPSFIVSPQKQIFKCFSSGVGGNAIKFVMEMERVDFWDAIQILNKDAHLNLDDYRQKTTARWESSHTASYQDKDQATMVMDKTQEYFFEQLSQSTDALKYLKEKRKLSDDVIKEFGLWYAPANSYSLLQYLKKYNFGADDAISLSLAKKWQGGDAYSFFRNRITFPIRDTIGRVVGFGARALSPEDQPKYLNSADNALYDKSKILYGIDVLKQTIKDYKKIIVVEWYMDVIGLYRLGMPVGVATCGTAMTDHHVKQLKRFSDEVYLLFDGDKAGQQATIRALKVAYSQSLYPQIIRLPDTYKDVDELANVAGGLQIFEQCIADGKDGFVSTFDRLKTQYNLTSPVEKQKFLHELFSLILVMDRVSMQDHYIRLLADSMGMDYQMILADMKSFRKADGKFLERQYQFDIPSIKKHEPDGVVAVASLLYEDFLSLRDTSDWLTLLLDFMKLVAQRQDDSFGRVARGEELHDDERNLLHESHLWRDDQLDGLVEQELVRRVRQVIDRQLMIYIQQLKTKGVDKDRFTEILELRTKLAKI